MQKQKEKEKADMERKKMMMVAVAVWRWELAQSKGAKKLVSLKLGYTAFEGLPWPRMYEKYNKSTNIY